jgi:hypothetical protein
VARDSQAGRELKGVQTVYAFVVQLKKYILPKRKVCKRNRLQARAHECTSKRTRALAQVHVVHHHQQQRAVLLASAEVRVAAVVVRWRKR